MTEEVEIPAADSTEEPARPQGVVAIVTRPDGFTHAANDFGLSGYGGFKSWEAQKHRAHEALARAVIDAYCSPIIGEMLRGYDERQILNRLIHEKKWRLTYHYVGYDKDDE